MTKHYLQDMKANELPTGFRVARWHPCEKLWIDATGNGDLTEAEEFVKALNSERLAGISYGIRTPYFVWHSGLTPADLEPYKH